MQRTTSNEFAYGANVVDDCPCPATAAGFNPDSDKSLPVAEIYDSVLSAVVGNVTEDCGTVDEQTAKEAWHRAIGYYEREIERTSDPHERRHYREVVEVGERVADELGWS